MCIYQQANTVTACVLCALDRTKEDAGRKLPEASGARLPDIQHAYSRNVPPGTRTRGHEPTGDGVSTVRRYGRIASHNNVAGVVFWSRV